MLLLSCQRLSRGFDEGPLFENVGFELFAGDRVGLVGPNGVGKTTLMKLLTGYLPCMRGRVLLDEQPITALEIGEIRGVNTSGVLGTLLERGLIKIAGRKNVVGRPFLYATTKEFLIRFGLNDLDDLPKIEDMAQALGFDPPAGLIERTPSEDVLPLQEPEGTSEAS